MAVFTFLIGKTTEDGSLVLLAGSFLGAMLLGPIAFLSEAKLGSLPYILLGLYLGIGPMGFGYLFWYWAIERDTSNYVPLFGFVTPVASTSWLLISGDYLSTQGMIGAGLIVCSCAYLMLRMARGIY